MHINYLINGLLFIQVNGDHCILFIECINVKYIISLLFKD